MWCEYACAFCGKSSEMWNYLYDPTIFYTALIISIVLYYIHYRYSKCRPMALYYAHTELNDFVAKSTAAFHKTYSPTIYLTNGNLQTIFYGIKRHYIASRFGITYEREMVKLDDGGQLAMDWPIYPEVDQKMTPETPVIAIMAGLTGGLKDIYVATMMKDGAKRGYKTVLVNQRGCSGTKMLVYILARAKSRPRNFIAGPAPTTRTVPSWPLGRSFPRTPCTPWACRSAPILSPT